MEIDLLPRILDGLLDSGAIHFVVAAAVLSLFMGWVNGQVKRAKSRKRAYRKPKPPDMAREFRTLQSARPNLADPAQQLEAISKIGFEKTRMLNKSEFPLLLALEEVVAGLGAGHRVMAQTSLGELIRPRVQGASAADQRDAQASINSKRLDFAIVDRFGLLALAVEYQGAGHYQGKAFIRDAVKREALRRAGVPFYEVEEQWSPEEVARRVRSYLGSGAAEPPAHLVQVRSTPDRDAAASGAGVR